MGRPYTCPWCRATTSVSKGVRRTKTMGQRRIRRCKSCGRKFTPKNQKPSESDGPEFVAEAQPELQPDQSVAGPTAPRAQG